MNNTALPAPIVELPYTDWQFAAPDNSNLTDHLEQGQVLCFPQLAFALSEQEQALLAPELVDPKRKTSASISTKIRSAA